MAGSPPVYSSAKRARLNALHSEGWSNSGY
jgi:hypothetical protein